jgi:hypothetical protein
VNIYQSIKTFGFIVCISITLFLINNCVSNSFEENCFEAADILKNAFMLEEFGDPSTVTVDGAPVEVVSSNKKKSRDYIERNREKLKTIYNQIRLFADQPNSENYINALYVCVTINQSLFMLTCPIFENEEDMTKRLLSDNAINEIDDWMLDEFYGKIFVHESMQEEWKKKENSKKFENIYNNIIFISKTKQRWEKTGK